MTLPTASTPSTPSGSSAIRSVLGSVDREELAANQKRLTFAYAFAATAVPAFTFFDFLFAGSAGFSVVPILAIRIVVTPIFVAGLVRLRDPQLSRAELDVWMDVATITLAVGMSLSVLATGALTSPYLPAMLLVGLGYPFVPRPSRRSLRSGIVAWLALPGLYFAQLAIAPELAAARLAPASLVLLAFNTAILGTMLAVVIMAAHWTWALRRAVFESRAIGRYEARRRIGRGGMGEVWAAWDGTLQREVALKILRTDEPDPTAVARFEREVRATIALTHPSTVRVFDFGTTSDGISYYAMELLEGRSLGQLLKDEGPLEIARAVHFALAASRALAEAHARGIVHRDLKPENLFVTRAGDEADFLKVLDFGIAKLSRHEGEALTQTGALAGTPQYLAPELVVGSAASPASDVYALGVVLFQMLTGRLPFEASESGAAMLLAHVTEPPLEVRALRPEVPAPLAALVARCLAKTSEERFETARALADALSALGIDAWQPARLTEPIRPSDDALAVAPSAAPTVSLGTRSRSKDSRSAS